MYALIRVHNIDDCFIVLGLLYLHIFLSLDPKPNKFVKYKKKNNEKYNIKSTGVYGIVVINKDAIIVGNLLTTKSGINAEKNLFNSYDNICLSIIFIAINY